MSESSAPVAIITGGTGFVGSHLVEYALGQGARVIVLVRRSPDVRDYPNLRHLAGQPQLELRTLDLAALSGSTNPALNDLLRQTQPDLIFHMAARSHIAPAWSDPAATLTANIMGTLALFEAVHTADLVPHTRILNPGSSDEYGYLRPEDIPVRETTPLRPGNPYAVSKVAQEMLGYQYAAARGLHIVNTRAFNAIGARQSAELAAGAFARQIVQAEQGIVPPVVRVGNLEARRDYCDVRDIARAYWLAVTSAAIQPGQPYNICSGTDRRIADLLAQMVAQSRARLSVELDPARMRPADVPVSRGDPRLFQQATGWQAEIPLEQSIAALLDWWRENLAVVG